MTDYQSAIDKLSKSLERIPRSELPSCWGELERIKAVIWAEFMTTEKGNQTRLCSTCQMSLYD